MSRLVSAVSICDLEFKIKYKRNQVDLRPQLLIETLERFSLRLTQFNLRILQSPLGFNRIRDGYSGSNLVKNALRDNDVEELSVTHYHAEHAARFDWGHRDPWDRLVAAQAILEECVLVSADITSKTRKTFNDLMRLISVYQRLKSILATLSDD